jgi:hypothetical protein
LLTQVINIHREDSLTTNLKKERKMHKISKKTCLLLITLLASSVLAALPVKGSTGNILIDTTVGPSGIVKINLGGDVNLYFGKVDFSGGQCRLYLSTNGYANLNYTTDIAYGPVFSVAKIRENATDTAAYSGYSVGYNWINGTIPTTLQVPGGNYWVKAYDGDTSSVAATDNYLTIEATFEVVPSSGPGQAAIELRGYALPPYGFANLSYNAGAGWVTIVNLYQADATGKFVYPTIAWDLKQALAAGPQPVTNTTIIYQMVVGSQTEQDTFDEFWRGLKQVKGKTSVTSADGFLYGHLTDFGLLGVDVEVLGNLIIAGKYFHPGTLNILWDGTLNIGTTTADGTGTFNTTVTVPITSKGTHNVTIDDGKLLFTFMINVIPTLKLVPDNGPVGTYVTAYGYGFEKSTATATYNVTLWWDYTDYCTQVSKNLTATQVDGTGRFVAYFYVPATVGGAHVVNATEDDAATTWAVDTFTVKATLTISPIEFSNDGTIITVTGTGLSRADWYDLCLDNKKNFYSGANNTYNQPTGTPVTSYFRPDCTGTFAFEFIAAGFSAGNHSVTL